MSLDNLRLAKNQLRLIQSLAVITKKKLMTKISQLALIVAAGLILSACSLIPSKQMTPDKSAEEMNESETTEQTEMMGDDTSESTMDAGKMKPLTMEEVALHTTPQDCWFVIEGNVYDVTPFIAAQKHPGGAAILEGCGKDATELFNTRPMGSGTPHDTKARDMMSDYYLGELITVPGMEASAAGEMAQ